MERDLDKSSSSQPSSYQCDHQTSHHPNSSQTSSSPSLDSFSTPPPPPSSDLPSSDLPSKRGKRVKRGYDEVDEAIIHHFQTQKNHMDEDHHFGLHVAARLRKLDGRRKALDTMKVHQVLTEVEYDLYFSPTQQHEPANNLIFLPEQHPQQHNTSSSIYTEFPSNTYTT